MLPSYIGDRPENRPTSMQALNVDEPDSGDHIHYRQLWLDIEQDTNGNRYYIVHQSKALEKMGVPLPNPDKPESQKNNRKMHLLFPYE